VLILFSLWGQWLSGYSHLPLNGDFAQAASDICGDPLSHLTQVNYRQERSVEPCRACRWQWYSDAML